MAQFFQCLISCMMLYMMMMIQDLNKVKLNGIIIVNRLKHRGPDWSGLYQHGDCFLAHQRLAIIDPASGDQPLYNEDKAIVVTVSFVNLHYN